MRPARRSPARPGRRGALALSVGAALLAALPLPAAAQSTWTVLGRVVDAQSGAPLANALVALEGRGAVLSSDRGLFRFERVPTSARSVRVQALGYRDLAVSVDVGSDTLLVLALEVLPIELEGLTVSLGTLDFDGQLRDPRSDSWVYEAEVRSDQGHYERTSLSGRFDLDDVYDGPPLRLTIRAFRYLPLDTTLVPDDAERHVFDLAPDPVMSRLIDGYVARLDDRAGQRIYRYQPALNRQELARFAPNATLRMVMEAKYPLHLLRRISCFMFDEREYRFGSNAEAVSVIEGTMASELERVELLEFPGQARLFMARIYTRRFFERQVVSPDSLRPASVTVTMGGVFCR